MRADQKAFITLLTPEAVASAKRTGVPASFTIAQACEESGYGTSKLSVNALNLFDIKADASWHGPTYAMPSEEVLDGKTVLVPANWRKYATFEECMTDHAQFFHVNPRYHAAFACKDGEGFTRAIAAAGYATDPAYAANIIAIIRECNLAALDHLATTKEPTMADSTSSAPTPPPVPHSAAATGIAGVGLTAFMPLLDYLTTALHLPPMTAQTQVMLGTLLFALGHGVYNAFYVRASKSNANQPGSSTT